MSRRPPVSALVPAWNAAETIGRCVAAIRTQSTPVAEVLVADDGSTDTTPALAAAAGARVLPLGGRQGICAGRNTLARSAVHDLLWYVDADSIPEPDCLERLHQARDAHPDAGLVHGINVLPPERATAANTAYAVLGRHHFLKTTPPRYTSHVTTANCLVPRAVIAAAGWFQHFRFGNTVLDFYEDYDLSLRARRLGYRCWFEPEAVTLHENPRRSMRAFLRHRVKCGLCSTLVRAKNRDLASFGVLYGRSPWLLVPLAGALAGYTALKALLVHLRQREMPAGAVLKAAPLVLLGQLCFTKGALQGAFRWRDLAGRIETP